MNPSDLLWWQWLLCALGGGVLSGIFYLLCVTYQQRERNIAATIFILFAYACAFGTIYSLAVGVVRFAKWAWGG